MTRILTAMVLFANLYSRVLHGKPEAPGEPLEQKLKRRLYRGEIDIRTYRRLRSQLKP